MEKQKTISVEPATHGILKDLAGQNHVTHSKAIELLIQGFSISSWSIEKDLPNIELRSDTALQTYLAWLYYKRGLLSQAEAESLIVDLQYNNLEGDAAGTIQSMIMSRNPRQTFEASITGHAIKKAIDQDKR